MPGEKPVVPEQTNSHPESVVEDHQNNVGIEQEVTSSSETAENVDSSGATPLPLAENSSESNDISSVSDPSLIDIDKFLQGEVVLVTEDSEEMAEAKHAKKNKKKSKEKLMESLQESLQSLPPEEQIAIVMEKYSELVENNRLLQSSVKQIQRQVENVQRERENMEAEHSKIILSKSRLESLCRELQRQNKLIKDENVSRLKEEEERRKEVASKFNSTLSEISNLMKENSDKNNKLRDENQDMAGRLQDLVKQYEARETHVEKILKAKDLQCQLAEAKLAKQHIELTESKEKMLLEKKTLLEDISSYQEKLQTMSETEISLRTQLNSYMEKYEEFQSTLDRSNKIFNTFKKEMDEMTKKIKKLEKETKTWKERWEGANKALLDMVSERSDLEKKIELQGRQNVQLQNLCRALQEQVTELRKQNKISSDSEIQADILNEVMATKEASTETVSEKKETKEESVQITPECPTPEDESMPTLVDVDPESEASKDIIETVSSTTSLEAPTNDTAGVNTSNTEGASKDGLNYLDVD